MMGGKVLGPSVRMKAQKNGRDFTIRCRLGLSFHGTIIGISFNGLSWFGFELNAVLTALVISWRSVTNESVTWPSHTSTDTTCFPKPQTAFLIYIRGGRRKPPERNFAATGYRIRNL